MRGQHGNRHRRRISIGSDQRGVQEKGRNGERESLENSEREDGPKKQPTQAPGAG